MQDWKNAVALVAVGAVCAVAGCTSKSPSVASPTGPSGLTAPQIDSPSADQQLDTLRPTLTVRNGAGGTGVRTYDFQLSENSSFSPVALSKLSVAENSSGKTSVTLDTDLKASMTYYWRVRMVNGGTATDWALSRFRSKISGYNRPGELVDYLTDGFSVGERFGQTTFVPGRGLRLETTTAYVRYKLPQSLPSGEFSMEVEGLEPKAGAKLAIFSMAQGEGPVNGNPFEVFTQYRGAPGNPDHCITFKAVMGGGAPLEPNLSQRSQAVMSLNASTTYFWQGTWSPNSFRLVVKAGGVNGNVVYDRELGPASGSYGPSPHVAYLGINSNDGSFPGMVVRNVWLGNRARPY